jgi:hypothetical protein
MGDDAQIVVSDHLALLFRLGANLPVGFGGCFRQHRCNSEPTGSSHLRRNSLRNLRLAKARLNYLGTAAAGVRGSTNGFVPWPMMGVQCVLLEIKKEVPASANRMEFIAHLGRTRNQYACKSTSGSDVLRHGFGTGHHARRTLAGRQYLCESCSGMRRVRRNSSVGFRCVLGCDESSTRSVRLEHV